MASQQNGEEIPCEYVYDKYKNEQKQDSSIFDGEYSEGNSEEEAKHDQDNPTPIAEKRSRTSKVKRRVSRYDSGDYALPDEDDEADMISVKAKMKAQKDEMVAQKSRLIAWRTTSCVSIFILLISLIGNVYLTAEKFGSLGNIFFTRIFMIPVALLKLALIF